MAIRAGLHLKAPPWTHAKLGTGDGVSGWRAISAAYSITVRSSSTYSGGDWAMKVIPFARSPKVLMHWRLTEHSWVGESSAKLKYPICYRRCRQTCGLRFKK